MKGVQAVHALIRKRTKLEGEIIATKAKLRRLTASLVYVGALKVFDSEIGPFAIPSKLEPQPYAAKKGQTLRIILTALKDAPDGLTCAQLSKIMMAKRA